jgi:glycosyltransferase involved in cell wall biosynthesis
MEKLTIGVPVHNEEKSIEITLDSLLDQDLSDLELEILVCDNGSRDNTREVVRNYIQSHKANIKLIELEEPSKSQAWNTIVELARTDYIVFCDGDALINQDAIKRLYDTIKQTDKLAVSGQDIPLRNKNPTLCERVQQIPKEVKGFYGIIGALYIVQTDAVATIHMPENINDDQFLAVSLGYENVKRCLEARVYVPGVTTFRDYFLNRVRIRTQKLKLKRDRGIKIDRSKGEPYYFPKPESTLPWYETLFLENLGRAVRLGAKMYSQLRHVFNIKKWDRIHTSKIGDMFDNYQEAKTHIQSHIIPKDL